MNNTNASSLSPQAWDYLSHWNDMLAGGLARLTGVNVTAQPVTDGPSENPAAGSPEASVWIRIFAGKAGEQAFLLTVKDPALL
ncbi:MAG: hypothetical protein KGM47_08325, partial [Acidobacteriota bacterium]|nr:hypothetical protein [Acidobacteriota bacterium]